MNATAPANILHLDLDAFYASVEQLREPKLRGKPVAVGGGVVLAASYEARVYGVRSAMPLREARRRCPRLIVVSGRFSEYLELSEQVFDICRDVTPFVEQISIDEAFMNVAGARRHFGTAPEIAALLRARVRDEVGLPASVGVARTKFLAKVASRRAKPDGVCVVDPAGEIEFLHALPVDVIWGVGPATERKLAELGVHTVGDLAHADERALVSRLGPGAGRHLLALAWNRDPRPVVTSRRAGSVGAQSAFGRDERDPEVYSRVLAGLADRVGSRMRKKQRAGRTVTVRVRFSDLQSVSRRTTLAAPIGSTEAILRVATRLADQAIAEEAKGRGVSLFGISVSKLVVSPHLQLELGLEGDDPGVDRGGSVAALSMDRLDDAIDALRARFGKDVVGRASVVLGRRRGVPTEFGDLAVPVSERHGDEGE